MQVITDSQAIEQARGQTAEQALEQKSVPRRPGAGVVDNSSNGQPAVAFQGGSQNTNEGANPPELTPEEQAKVAGPVFNPEGEAVAFQPNGPSTDDEKPTDTNDTNITTVADNKVVSAEPAKKTMPYNKLHDYPSYTYRITLFVLTKADYQILIKEPENFRPKHVLISSGGGFAVTGDVPGRHPDFNEDFFIDKLSIETVVGLNAKTKSSNAVSMNFQITEPYGMTLLDRLLSCCETEPVNCKNYLEQPYMLQIDFLGNATDPATSENIIIDQKRLAIKFLGMKISPGPNGTVYTIDAIPFNHGAFQEGAVTVPVNINVEAGTVGQFFDATITEAAKIFNKDGIATENAERAETELKKWIKDQPLDGKNLTETEINRQRRQILGSMAVTTGSLPNAYNNYYRAISGEDKRYRYEPYQILFNVADVFADSKIVDSLKSETRTTPMEPVSGQGGGSWGQPILKKSKQVQVFPIRSGTSLTSLIDKVMQSSEYCTSQVNSFNKAQAELKEAEKNKDQDRAAEASATMDEYKFLDWFKVIPQVTLGPFDEGTNAYSKVILFSIIPYRVANSYHPDFKKTKIKRKSIVRRYEYLYTGQNSDILEFNCDFDSAFFTAVTSYRAAKTSAGASQSKSESSPDNQVKDDNKKTSAKDSKPQNPPVRTAPVGANASGSGQMNSQDNSEVLSVADVATSIYTSSRGDMLNVKLRIIGDPAFFKQDDVYFNPAAEGYKDFASFDSPDDAPIRPETGQIVFDNGQVYCQLVTKNAVDIDDATGITNKQIKLSNGRTTDGSFSGLYKLLTITNIFTGGKFEQSIDMVKMPDDLFEDEDQESNLNQTDVTVGTVSSDDDPNSNVNYIKANPVPEQEPQTATNVLGIQGNDLSKLQSARDSDPDSEWPIVNGAGAPNTPSQVTQASPANINDTNVEIQQSVAFGTAQNTNQGQN